MLKWALVALVVVFLYRYATTRPRYGRLFSAAHLMEIDRGLERARLAAIERIGEGAAEDPFAAGTAFMTTADIAMFYSIAKTERGSFEHHVSLSYRGGPFARAAGGFLVAAIRRLLDLTTAESEVAESSRGVYHFIFLRSPDEQARFAARRREPLDEAAAQNLVVTAMDDREALLARLGRIDVDLDQAGGKKPG